jgi:ribokinase
VSAPVWVLGNLTIDDVVLSDGQTAMGLCGGNAIYASLGARRWADVTLAARVGPDYPPQHLAALRAAGVQLALAPVPYPSIHHWALYESDAMRRFISWVDSGSHAEQSIRPEELPADIGTASACHLAPMPLEIQAVLAKRLRELGVPIISLDPHDEYIAGHERELENLLSSVTVFLPSRYEAKLLFGRDDPEHAALAFASAGPSAVVVKLGAEGSIVCAPGLDTQHIPAVQVLAIDPTGCGDAFCGGFVAAYVAGADPVTAACHGTVSASFAAETRGALDVLPLDSDAAGRRFATLLAEVNPSALTQSTTASLPEAPTGGPMHPHG